MRTRVLIPIIILSFLLLGCFEGLFGREAFVSIAPRTVRVTVGETAQFSASGRSDEGETQDVTESATWSVYGRGGGVASLGGGTFTAIRPGEYMIKAAWGKPKGQDQATIVVVEAPAGTPAEQTEPDDPEILRYQERPEGDPVEVFRVGNDQAVFNGGKSPTVEFPTEHYLTEITTYHWNESKGTPAGTIALKSADGTVFGPWKATLVNGVYWVAKPGVSIPAGSYTVVDSDPGTWAQNTQCGGMGMTWASGIPVK